MSSVVLRGLTKVYPQGKGAGVRAVHNVDLEVRQGELMVLVGPSGCGKSTLLRMIAGLEVATDGSIEIGGRIVNAVPPKDRNTAMVFQNYALFPYMTVFENMAFGLKFRKVQRDEIRQRVNEAAEILHLTKLLKRKPAELSGGQRQRVAVGRAMVCQPSVFLFDEPLSNLDAKMRTQMRAEIAKLHERLRATMIFVTHDQTEAMTLGQRICVLNEGRVMQVGEPLQVYREPRNKFVAGFIGSPGMNFLRGRLEHDGNRLLFLLTGQTHASRSFSVELKRREIEPLLIGRELELGIRPEDLELAPCSEAPVERGFIRADIEANESLGHEALVYCKADSISLVARCTASLADELRDSVQVRLNFDRFRFFDPVTQEAI